MSNADQSITATEESELLEIIQRWSKAVRDEDFEAIRARHDPGILMFDVPRPSSLAESTPIWRPGSCSINSLPRPLNSISTTFRSTQATKSPLLPPSDTAEISSLTAKRSPSIFASPWGFARLTAGGKSFMNIIRCLPSSGLYYGVTLAFNNALCSSNSTWPSGKISPSFLHGMNRVIQSRRKSINLARSEISSSGE